MTTAPLRGDALAARRDALDLTGWGKPFRFWQPHNLCFWVFSALFLVGGVHFLQYFSPGTADFGAAIGVGALAVAVYGLIFVVFLRLTDHYERQPKTLVLAAFLWGGVASTFGFALTANDALIPIYGKLFGPGFASDWGAALTAPLTEETSKAAGFILLLGLAPHLIRSAYDGVFVGAFIGLGFQIFENLLYSYNTAVGAFGVDQVSSALGTFWMRAAVGIFSHTLFSALFCLGIVYVVGSPIQRRRLGLGIVLMLLAMVTHGSWDGSAALGGGTGLGMGISIALGVVALVVVVLALRRTAPQEAMYLRAVLQPEVDNGTISEQELDAVCSSRRGRRRAAREAGHDHGAHRRARHVQRAIFDLAHELALSGGEESPGVAHERAEIERLRGAPAPGSGTPHDPQADGLTEAPTGA